MCRILRILALLGLFVAAGCSESSVELGGGGTVGEDEVVTDRAGFTVGLIERGADAQVTLRIANKPGTTQSVLTTVEQTMQVSGIGGDQTLEQSQTAAVTYRVLDTEDGIADVETTYDRMSIDSAQTPPELARALADAFVGVTSTAEMTDRGAIVSLNLPDISLDGAVPGVPPGVLDQVADQVIAAVEESAVTFAIPTPVQAVGVDATWSATAESTITGIPMRIESRITLTEITDDEAIGRIDQTITLIEGDVDLFGISATVEEGELVGTGTITYLREVGIVPLMDMDMSGTMSMSVQGQTFTQTMEMHQTTRPA